MVIRVSFNASIHSDEVASNVLTTPLCLFKSKDVPDNWIENVPFIVTVITSSVIRTVGEKVSSSNPVGASVSRDSLDGDRLGIDVGCVS